MMAPPPSTQDTARSRLERVLRSGRFAVTAELNPPDSADPQEVYDAAIVLSSICDGINAVDASGANCHMSSVAICALLTRAGYEPVFQISCRDRNRIAIQGDLLGAAAMGVRNVLCITGDDVTAGDQPQAKRVFDLDSIQLLQTARLMRDQGVYLSGRKLTVPPPLFLGAAENPFAPPFDWRAQRLAKKIAAGAEFIQTQYCFDVPRMQRFMQQVRDLGLHEHCFILAGVGRCGRLAPLNSCGPKYQGSFSPTASSHASTACPKPDSAPKANRSASKSSSKCARSPG